MEIVLLIIIVGVILFALFSGKKEFDDPQPMSNHHLLSAIAGQADWLEKMSRSPIESQNSPSIVEIAMKRRGYISRLCLEVLSRGIAGPGQNEPKYPGATVALNIFEEVVEYVKELEATGISKEVAAVRSVKEKLFVANGVIYPSRWEL
jgi:hypothetical protein